MAIKSADQVTIIDVTDAYSVMLTSEACNLTGGSGGVAAGQSCFTEAVAFCGSNQCASVTVNKNDIVCPSGFSVAVENSGTSKVKITFTTTSTITTNCEATIPVVVDDITVNKKFSIAVALAGKTGATGATGTSITGVTNYFLVSTASTGVTTSTSGWTTTMQATDTSKKYLWSYQKITYSNKTTSDTIPVIIGTHGATGGTGATGKGVKAVQSYYLTTSAATGVTTSTTGWGTTPTATTTTNKYLWSYQKFTYTDNTTSNTTPAIIGTHGATGNTGAAGKDAITLTIIASNGAIFKNSSGSTTLAAHVYKGGIEQTISDAGVVSGGLGTIKWYKGGTTDAIATAKTLTISANDVDNTQVYTCQLEG